MSIYTASYAYSGPDRLDITVKGQDPLGRIFAPTWEMVRGLKNGAITEEIYERMYRALMNERYQLERPSFDFLRNSPGTRTLVCFCPPGAFCHRLILAEGLDGLGAIYQGERNFLLENENVYEEGDMLNVKKGILVQQVNCKGVMGAGLAKAIRDKWPIVLEKYLYLWNERENPLGQALLVQVAEELYVANLFGQYFYGREKRRYTNYAALRQALKSLRRWREAAREAAGEDLPIYFPYRMSCGLAGGNWYLVFKMIRNLFPDAIVGRKGV